jgi:hypothetical protein
MTRFLYNVWKSLLEVTMRDFWWFELLSALALLTWGFVAITAPDRLSERHFGPLLYWVREEYLENSVLIVATIQFCSVVTFQQWLRVGGDILASLLTGFIFLGILLAGTHPQPGIGYYGVAWAGNLLAASKLIRNRKYA